MGNDPRFRAYPRGFLGAQLDVGSFQPVANPQVESVYSQYIKNNIATGAPVFRRKILQTAIASFGTMDFLAWLQAQANNKLLGDLHQRFLIDTLRFINTGRRDIALESWDALLRSKEERAQLNLNNEVAASFLRRYGVVRLDKTLNQRIDLLDVIQNWCSQPGGLEDLLGTTHLLFGNA